MDTVTLNVSIDRPREEVFAYLADVANHPEFSDHYLKDWHLTREDSAGRGAGARYKQDGRFDRFGHYDLSFAEVDPPYRIIAVGRGGKYNRIKTFHQWTLEPTSSGTRLEYVYETEPPLPSDRPHGGPERSPQLVPAQRGARSEAAADHPRGGAPARARATVAGLGLLAALCAVSPASRCFSPSARLAALVAAGCNKEEVSVEASTEGPYVTVNDLKYQVQISRILNPGEPEDVGYLRGLPRARQLTAPRTSGSGCSCGSRTTPMSRTRWRPDSTI